VNSWILFSNICILVVGKASETLSAEIRENVMDKIWEKSYTKGVLTTIDINKYGSIAEILNRSFNRFGGKPAYHNMGTTLTFSQLKEKSLKFASYLQNDLGLKEGARVALMMPNVIQYPIALFGVLQAKMIAVNVNPLYTARELKYQLVDSGAEALVVFANAGSVVESILADTPVKHVIITELGDQLKFPKSMIVNFVIKNIKKMVPSYRLPTAIKFNDVLLKGDSKKFKKPKISHADTAFLQYTGGTTGVSKGAILTHGNIVANVLQASGWISPVMRDGEEIVITPLPLYHIFSLTANCLTFAALGGLNVLITNPRDMPGFIKELRKWKFTTITGVNTLFNGLIHAPGFSELDFSSLRLSLGGGMAVQRAVADRWKQITGHPLIEAYGLTETSPAACMNPVDLKSYNGFVGLPIASTEVAILSESEEKLKIGEIGEIAIKGPQVMVGYWQKPEETALVLTKDGFLKTGDIGFMDPMGFVKIVDRKKDMILVSGFNVYPNEVEDVIASHPGVLEVAAIGVPDERSGESVKVFVVKKIPSLTEKELKEFCEKELTGYKVPKQFEFRDSLPKTNVGKILRRELRS
jgi:long-chain acyl-CoA synthetase